MNAWDMLAPDKAAAIHVKKGKRCHDRLNGERCLREQGHESNHAILDPLRAPK